MFPLRYDEHRCPACLESAGVCNNITVASDSYCDGFEKGPFFSCPLSHPCSDNAEQGHVDFRVPTCASVNKGYVPGQNPAVEVKSPIDCQAQCRNGPMCDFFTWDKHGSKFYFWHHANGTTPNPSAMPGLFSGPQSCPTPPTEPTCTLSSFSLAKPNG